MSGLYEKSLNKLELTSVLELLAGEAVSGAAKEVCREIKPESDVEEVRRLLEQTWRVSKPVISSSTEPPRSAASRLARTH